MEIKNKLVWIVSVFVLLNIFAFVGFRLVVNKASDRVIDKLQKDYSPSPYGPGIDPDKADPETLKNDKYYLQLKQGASHSEAIMSQSVYDKVRQADLWREQWEKERGFSQ